MNQLEPRDRVILATLIIAAISFLGTVGITARVMWPKQYMEVCFQKIQPELQIGVVVPGSLCTSKDDKIVRLQIK